MYKYFLKFVLFLLPPETAHHLITRIMQVVYNIPIISLIAKKLFKVNNDALKRKVFGIEFSNPVGLAAGFDKDARFIKELSVFGFGFIEIGTVTPLPQPGNPPPRLFRLKSDAALINRMGFNNGGVIAAAERLKRSKTKILVGGNIGKNKNTPNSKAFEDYELCFKTLYPWVDYFVVNVSSPNTPGLRELQDKEPLLKLLQGLNALNDEFKNKFETDRKPILLKIAPDLTNAQLDDIILIVNETKTDGIVATNTTLSRENLLSKNAAEAGGLSGKPLAKRSTEVIKYLVEKSNHAFPVIGVGGIHSPEDALEKLNAGASLVQIYTGFIYEGPGLVRRILKEILKQKW